jgi:hypothetical protein
MQERSALLQQQHPDDYVAILKQWRPSLREVMC